MFTQFAQEFHVVKEKTLQEHSLITMQQEGHLWFQSHGKNIVRLESAFWAPQSLMILYKHNFQQKECEVWKEHDENTHLLFTSSSANSVGMREKYFPIFSHKFDLGIHPLCAWIVWILASCLAMSLK